MKITRKLVEEFLLLSYLSTRNPYRSALRFFIGLEAEVGPIQEVVNEWADIPEGTFGVRRAALNKFLDYLESKGLTGPIKKSIMYPSPSDGGRGRPITDSEIEKMRGAVRTDEERIMIMVLEDLGLRLGTLAHLKVRHLISDDPSRVKAKGKSDALVIPTSRIREEVLRYAQSRNLDHGDFVFNGRFGEKPVYSDIWAMFDRVRSRAGTDGLLPHCYRHAFATQMSRKKVPLEITQKLMGHKRVESTVRYITVGQDELYDALETRSRGLQ